MARLIFLAGPTLAILFPFFQLLGEPPSPLDLIDRFKTEAPAAWARYMALAAGFQGDVTVTSSNPTESMPNEVHFYYKIKQSGEQALLQTRRQNGLNTTLNIAGINSKYAFDLIGVKESALRIKQLTFFDSSENVIKRFPFSIKPRLQRFTCANLYVSEMFMPNFLHIPQFKIKNVTPDPSSGHEQAVKIEYEFVQLKNVPDMLRHGRFRVDPAREWTVLDYWVVNENETSKRVNTGTFEYAAGSKSPLVKRLVATVETSRGKKNKTLQRQDVTEFGLHFQDKIEDKEFALSAFGLPELDKSTWDIHQATAELLEDDTEYLIEELKNPSAKDASRVESGDASYFSGKRSLAVTPFQSYRSHIPLWDYRIAENPQPGEYRYLRFAWKRTMGPGIMLQLHATPETWHRYYAGFVDDKTKAWGAMTPIADDVPRAWQLVTRDLFMDFGPIRVTGISFTPMSGGGYGFYDHIYLGRTIEDLDRITERLKNVVEGSGEPGLLASAPDVSLRRRGIWVLAGVLILFLVIVLAWWRGRRRAEAANGDSHLGSKDA